MTYLSTISCRDGQTRTVRIFDNDDEDVRPIRLTELSFGHSFKPFETIVPQTGIVGIYFDAHDTEDEEDPIRYIVPVDNTSHRITITRNDGVVEFDGYLVPNSASIPMGNGESVTFNITSRLGLLDSIDASFIVDPSETMKQYSLFQLASKALCENQLYTSQDSMLLPLGATSPNSVLDDMIIGTDSFFDFFDENIEYLNPDAEELIARKPYTVKEIIEKVAGQTFCTFFDRGSYVCVTTSRPTARFSLRAIRAIGWGSPAQATILPNTPADIEGRTFTDSNWSLILPASRVTFNGQYENGDVTLSPDDFYMKKKTGGNAKYGDAVDERKLILGDLLGGGEADDQHEGTIRFLNTEVGQRYCKTRNVRLGANVVPAWFGTDAFSGLALFYEYPLIHQSQQYAGMFFVNPQWLISCPAGKIVLSFDFAMCKVQNRTGEYQIDVLKNYRGTDSDERKTAYRLRSRLINESTGQTMGTVVRTELIKMDEDYKQTRVEMELNVAEGLTNNQISVSLEYIMDDTRTTDAGLVPFVSNIRLSYHRPDDYYNDEIPTTFVYDLSRQVGPDQTFAVPFLQFDPNYNALSKNCVKLADGADADLLRSQMKEVARQYRVARKQYKLKMPLRQMGDATSFLYEGNYGYGGEQHDLMAGTTEYTINRILSL